MLSNSPIVARAFAPAHITGFFAIYPQGSTGAGLNMKDGAVTTVRVSDASTGMESEETVLLNSIDSEAPVSRRVIAAFAASLGGKSLRVEHETAFPVGYGVGMSGAGVFSLALALNAALSAGLSYTECQKIAEEAEIFCGTGLGTVTSQVYHGLMIGRPPYPSKTADNIPTDISAVVTAFFEPIETASIIRDPEWKQKINATGLLCTEALREKPSAENLISLSRHFTETTGLAGPEVREAMKLVPEASMAMLGQTVFALTNDPAKVEKRFRTLTDRVVVSSLATFGARLVD